MFGTIRKIVSARCICMCAINLHQKGHKVFGYACFSTYHINLSKAFWRNLFDYFLFLAETNTICANVFYVVRNEILVASDKK